MDILLLIIGFLLTLLGVLGAFLPILPGPLTSWIGLLLLHLTKAIPVNYTFLGWTLFLFIFIWVLDYFLPSIGAKKFGGSKYGITGTSIGLFVGLLFFPPFGLIIGSFIGAFFGELINNHKNGQLALKAAFGSFIGFVTSTLLKFAVSALFIGLYIYKFWEHKSAFFNLY